MISMGRKIVISIDRGVRGFGIWDLGFEIWNLELFALGG
jgi:hypothetical protein